jgi:hypothetical protein
VLVGQGRVVVLLETVVIRHRSLQVSSRFSARLPRPLAGEPRNDDRVISDDRRPGKVPRR